MGNLFSNRPKYEACTNKEIEEKLKEYGVCYVPNVLTDKERFALISGTWDFFEHLTQNDGEDAIKRHNKDSWQQLSSLCPINHMLYNRWNAGHAQHSWDIRQNPHIVNIFAEFWKCKAEDLLVSFDSFGFLPPPEVTNEGWYTPKTEWYHLDQSLKRPYFDGVQAMVTAYDINEGDATLTFFEQSHKYIYDFIEIFGTKSDSDWVPFNSDEVNFFNDRCKKVGIMCPSKSLIIWDSRLVHCGIGPKKERKVENTRCISYISYSNKNKISDEQLNCKKMAFENMITSNHYAHNPNYINTLPPHHDNIENYVVPINPPVLTDLGKSLVGYSREELV
jgi:hypothetical protein